MNDPTNRRKALILSPTASHPQDHGNRNRVFHTTSYLKDAGYDIHFILYPMEKDWENELPESSAKMTSAWTSFAIVPPSRPLHQLAAGEHHSIDEWWDPQIESHLKWLFAREWFDLFVVNYTFFSKAFELAPSSTVKVLETHDMFAGRRELFEANKAPVEFFYTTAKEEAIALKRADVVVAIKDEEAEGLRSIAAGTETISVPFFPAAGLVSKRPERLDRSQELKVGFIGALNSVNVLNMQRFLDKFEQYRTVYVPPPISIVLAGNVCSQLRSNSPWVTWLGRVEDVGEFYTNIDVVVAPMAFSTGIKIKVGEALAYGKPVVATRNGFDGFPVLDRFHSLENVNEVCRALITLAFDRDRLLRLERQSAVSAELAKRRSEDGYTALKRAVARRSKRIVFITDEMIWHNKSFRQARLSQWCDFCSHMARTVILYVGQDHAPHLRPDRPVNKRTEFHTLPPDPDAIVRAVEGLSQLYFVAEAVVAVSEDLGQKIWTSLKTHIKHVTLDDWGSHPAKSSPMDSADIWIWGENSADSQNGQPLATTALRYAPPGFERSRIARQNAPILIAQCGCNKIDQIGMDFLRCHDRLSTRRVVTVDVTYDDQGNSSSFANLQKLEAPEVVIAVGGDRRAAEISRCLATFWGARFIWAGADRFPIYVDDAGTANLCWTFGELADCLSTSGKQGPGATEHSADGGWSTYWRLINRRKHPHISPVAEDR